MENLRLILILIGIVVLALIWLLHRPEGSRGPGASRRDDRGQGGGQGGGQVGGRPGRREPRVGGLPETGQPDEQDREPHLSGEPRQTTLPDLGSERPEPGSPDTEVRKRRAPAAEVPPETAWREPEETRREAASAAVAPEADDGEPPVIVTLYVRARGDRRISGLSLLDAAIKAGLRFGEMKIFHRRHRGEPRPVFSMANITRPGSFDPSGWNLFETPGVTLFMTLPGPVSALDAWDAMLATGQRLSELLDAELLDDNHCLLTRQRTAQIREQMREFDRKAGLKG
ncbi:MAG: cell division protein ZipA [Wenzhouxiangellaceae bacterium]|nr:cell division protein ZipA [Wenzhouxiangellaceae bacterium]